MSALALAREEGVRGRSMSRESWCQLGELRGQDGESRRGHGHGRESVCSLINGIVLKGSALKRGLHWMS